MMSRIFYYNLLLRGAVYLLPSFAFGMSSHLPLAAAHAPINHPILPQYHLILLLFTQLVWILAAEYYKLSTVAELFWEYTGIRAAFLACFATFLLQTAFLVFVQDLIVSRTFILLSNLFLFLLVVATRNWFRLTSASANWRSQCEKIVVVGTDQYARRCVRLLRRVPLFQCQVQAYLQLPGQPVTVDDAPVITATEPSRVEKLSFEEVVVALPAKRYSQVSSLVENFQSLGKPVRAVFDLGPRLSLKDKLFQAGRLQMMSLAISPTESFAYTVLKRTFDLLSAIVGLVVLSPFFVVIAAMVKLSSPGPVFFTQERVGRHGRLFNMIKFRTMFCSSREESDTIWTTRDDVRVTPIGAILRKFSLDELPQLVNVIRGEMSIVGPRPERPFFVAKFREKIHRYNMRHCCQVGITGWAQINGLRGDTSIIDRLQYDLYYIRNWSFVLDLQIIARTAFVALGSDSSGY
jgi:exopolysaccharide biosynthesis polyprenyl glycosylphosphotransferase